MRFEKMYGPDGMTMYLAAADETTILMGYTEPSLIEAALQASKSDAQQLSLDAGIQSTRQRLPSGAQAIGFWSPSGTVAFAQRMMTMFGGEESKQLPELSESPPLGWSIRTSENLIKIDTVIPAETIASIAEFVTRMRQFEPPR